MYKDWKTSPLERFLTLSRYCLIEVDNIMNSHDIITRAQRIVDNGGLIFPPLNLSNRNVGNTN